MKNSKRIITLLLALVMALSLVAMAGCGGGTGKTNSHERVIEASGDDEFFDGVPEELEGSTVYFATWIDHTQNESGLVFEDFTARTGINVKLTAIQQSEYPAKLTGLISSDQSPDVLVDIMFPSILAHLMPLEEAGVDATDPFWDQKITEIGHIGKYHYLVNGANSVWRMGTPVVTFHRTNMEDYGIKTPTDYVEEDNWNLETFKKCAEQCKALIPNLQYGVSITGERWLAIYGNSAIKYDAATSTFSNESTSAASVEAWKYLLELKEAGLAVTNDLTGEGNFGGGKTAMFVGGGYSMRADGWFVGKVEFDDMGFTVLPKANADDEEYPYGAQWRAYGICKGAKNPVAAGYFLRYYLNGDHYDLPNVFKTEEALNLYKDSVSKWDYDNIDWVEPTSNVGSGLSANTILAAGHNSTVAQLNVNLQTLNNKVQELTDLANQAIQNVIANQ